MKEKKRVVRVNKVFRCWGSILLLALLTLTACTKGPSLPEAEEISSIKVSLFAKHNISGTIPKDKFQTVISLFSTALDDHEPAKWRELGLIKIQKVDNTVLDIFLYETKAQQGAFQIGGNYYLGKEDSIVISTLTELIKGE